MKVGAILAQLTEGLLSCGPIRSAVDNINGMDMDRRRVLGVQVGAILAQPPNGLLRRVSIRLIIVDIVNDYWSANVMLGGLVDEVDGLGIVTT